MSAAHTPGPWTATLARTLIHIGNSYRNVCSISISPPRIPERDMREQAVASAQADARLIAAAPDLLAALQELHALVVGECPSLLNEDSGGNARLDLEIRAAIAKAVAV